MNDEKHDRSSETREEITSQVEMEPRKRDRATEFTDVPPSQVPSYSLVPDRSQGDSSKNTRGEKPSHLGWPAGQTRSQLPVPRLTEASRRTEKGRQTARKRSETRTESQPMPVIRSDPSCSEDRNKQARTADPAVGQPFTLITLSGSLDN